MPNTTLPDWERVLSAAAHLQEYLPEAVLVGGTAAALYTGHRISTDADHILTDLQKRFDQVLTDLEAVTGWQTARIQKPVQILGSLDGIETGVRQLIREEPLETTQVEFKDKKITIPTQAEILRIKGVLILKRNATRDYLDFAALAKHLGDEGLVNALQPFDHLYPQLNGESALQQMMIQIANPIPFDLEEMNLSEYKHLETNWQNWENVKNTLIKVSLLIFDKIVGVEDN